ncbi:MAG TPA: hypothetical protein VKR54_04085 [Candidatus Babeliales bacterium]|jgi:hypothetical protein|nr:hypothetical protein [Candidatus Babeliales bacterium]
MKKLSKKCFQIASIALFTFIMPSYCSEQPWYSSIIEKNLYGMSVAVTNFVMGIRTINKLIMATNPDKFIKIHKNRLAQIEKNIRADEQNQFYEIAKEHDLRDTDIKIGLEIINKINLSYRESHSKPSPNVVHDKNISPELFNIIRKKLAEGNIDINNVSITNSDISSPHESVADNGHFYVCTYTIAQGGSISSVSYSNNKPIHITFYPKFHLLNKCSQQTTCIHEATHIIEGHNITEGVVPDLIGRVTQKNSSDVEKSKGFQKLVQIHERQAEVLPSLKDPEVASLMREDRCTSYYPNRLYGKHYLQLSHIDETHKMIAYLEHIKKYPLKPIPSIQKTILKSFELKNA